MAQGNAYHFLQSEIKASVPYIPLFLRFISRFSSKEFSGGHYSFFPFTTSNWESICVWFTQASQFDGPSMNLWSYTLITPSHWFILFYIAPPFSRIHGKFVQHWMAQNSGFLSRTNPGFHWVDQHFHTYFPLCDPFTLLKSMDLSQSNYCSLKIKPPLCT